MPIGIFSPSLLLIKVTNTQDMGEDYDSTCHRFMREYKSLIQQKKRNDYLAIASDVNYLHKCDHHG